MKKLFKRRKEEKSKHITNDTIEEHREEVLSKGRKFKYPFQYAKHRLVINTIAIGVIAVALLVGFGWLQLYKFQSTNDVLYRLTKAIPVPVAKIDESYVRYSDYLMIYKSSVTAIENQQGGLGNSEADNAIRDQYKRQALDNAQEFTYALKLAEELEIEISREQILEAEKEHRTVDGVERSEESFAKIIRTNFGLSVSEYERLLMLSLTKREVSAAIDEDAKILTDDIAGMLEKNKGDFAGVAETLNGEVFYEETGGLVNEMNLDGGRANVASRLEIGEWSEGFLSRNGDGYYFVKLVGKSSGQVNYVSIRVPFREFNKRITSLRDEGKIKEYIHIDQPGDEEKTDAQKTSKL